MVWGLFRTKKVKPAAGKTGYWRTVWRRVRDSNPRSLSGHSISSAAPSTTRTTLQGLSQHQNYLGKRGELMGRTSKNIKFRIPEKPRKIKGFRLGGYRTATTISSHVRYDHFDTSPCDCNIISHPMKNCNTFFEKIPNAHFIRRKIAEYSPPKHHIALNSKDL